MGGFGKVAQPRDPDEKYDHVCCLRRGQRRANNLFKSTRFVARLKSGVAKNMRVLSIPPAAQRDEEAIQMISAWIAESGLHCTLNIGMWQAQGRTESKAWGILLADIVRHIANAIAETHGTPPDETIEQLRSAFERELGTPTSAVRGRFSNGNH